MTVSTRLLALSGLLLAAVWGCSGPGTSQSATAPHLLKVAFKQNDSYRYSYHQMLEGSLSMGGLAQPLKVDTSGNATWRVVSSDSNGVTIIDVTLDHFKSTTSAAGTTTTTTTDRQQFQIKVASDGKIVDGGYAGSGSPAAGVGVGDQFLPILPDHSVKPGDTWTQDFSRPNPFGTGSSTLTTSNKLLRYEQVKGRQAAVVESLLTSLVNVSLDPQKLASGIQVSPAPDLGSASLPPIAIQGTVKSDLVSWVDVDAQQVLKVDESSDFDITLNSASPAATGLGAASSLGPIHFVGKQTTRLEQQ